MINEKKLFYASCIALIATAMSFAIRGDILGDFETNFVAPYADTIAPVEEPGDAADLAVAEGAAEGTSTGELLGVIATVAFWSFGLAILFGGPLCDLLGMGTLLRLAALSHIGGVLLTIFAPGYWTIVVATFIVGLGNGLVEAVCNPLIATMYPDQKTKKLTLFHAWFPGGIVIGGVLAYALSYFGFGPGSDWGWQIKMGLILIPAVIYTVMIFGEKFPATERRAAGIPFGEMFTEAVRRPLFIIILLTMWMTAATELGPGAWIANIYNEVMSGITAEAATAGVLLLVWGNGFMWILRQFFSGTAHRVTPTVLIMATAPFAALGLWMVTFADSVFMWFLATTFLYLGVAFWWPTMLGITSERFPRTGAFGLAVVGAMGAFSTAIAGPVMGWLNDTYGADRVLVIWSVLPALVFVIFLLIVLYDRTRGGYRTQVERLHTEAVAEGVIEPEPQKAAVL